MTSAFGSGTIQAPLPAGQASESTVVPSPKRIRQKYETSDGAPTSATTATAAPSTSVIETVPTGASSRVRCSVASSPAVPPPPSASVALGRPHAERHEQHDQDRRRDGEPTPPPQRRSRLPGSRVRRQPGEHALVEAERRLHRGDGRQQVRQRRREVVVGVAARRAPHQVGRHHGAPVGVDIADHEVDDLVAEVGVTGRPGTPLEVPPVSHADPPSPRPVVEPRPPGGAAARS